jgi:Na+-transporting NADH:ubiquinone oxidoreductase subunit C
VAADADRPHPEDRAAEPGVARTLAIAFAVCAGCAALVSASVVLLRPFQLANQRGAGEARVRALVAAIPGLSAWAEGAEGASVELRAVELASGTYAPDVDPEALLRGEDVGGAGQALAPADDPAGVERMPRVAPVYELREAGRLHTVILPVHGRGYVSQIRGYLAVAADGNTIRGLAIGEHQETPGLGAEIERPEWQQRWQGKRLRDEAGRVRIRVVRDAPASDSADAAFEVQGISGATRTGDGVGTLVRFWAGPAGFGAYLARLREGGDA